jgi:hypothetical protein
MEEFNAHRIIRKARKETKVGRPLYRVGREKISMAPGAIGILWQAHRLLVTWGQNRFFPTARNF